MPDLRICPLQPEEIGGLFGRQESVVKSSFLSRFGPRTLAWLIGFAVVILFIVLAAADHALASPKGVATAVSLIISSPPKAPAQVSLLLLQDPVGLIAIAMTLATPIFCATQVSQIKEFNAANERNIAYRAGELDASAINAHAEHANGQFKKVGNRGRSALLLVASLGFSFLFDYFAWREGLFGSWKNIEVAANNKPLTSDAWRKEVYAGWWANYHRHLLLAIALLLLGGYFFYFLQKQLTMGLIFVVFMQRVKGYGFGFVPDMSANTDGYWGLRNLRRLMRTTYLSTLGHLVMVLGLLVVWLPFSEFTILMVIAVMTINIIVVLYPSAAASASIVREKKTFVSHLLSSRRPSTARDAVIDRVWSAPNLPFRVRSTLSAGTLYLLIPLVLAVVSSRLGK